MRSQTAREQTSVVVSRRKTRAVYLCGGISTVLMFGCSVDEQPFSSIEVFKQGLATQEAKLLASDGESDDKFGFAVSISGNTSVIGAPMDDSFGVNSGSVYVYEKMGSTWTQQQKFIPSDGEDHKNFGFSVSVYENTLLIGARQDNDNGSASGSAYVFERTGTTWVQQQKITASDGDSLDWFGCSVSLSENFAVIGAFGDEMRGSDSGSAYVFERTGTTWVQQQKITASDGAIDDAFGISVSISNDIILVGSQGSDNGVQFSSKGAVYIFKRIETAWVEQQKIVAADGVPSDQFGNSVAISDETLMVGAFSDDKGLDSGSCYVFHRNGESWNQTQKLTAPDGAPLDHFGFSLDVSNDIAVIGAYGDDDRGSNAGSAYLFRRNGLTWKYQYKISATDGNENDNFGYYHAAIALDGNSLAVGSPQDFPGGSAYVFHIAFPPEITTPISESTLVGVNTSFIWTSNGTSVDEYWLYVGNSYGSGNLFNSGSLSSSTLSQTVTGLPTDGRTLFVRLWYKESGTWKFRDYTYTASGTQPTPSMVSPTTETILNGSSVTFSWSSNGATVCNWWLYAGSGKGFKNFHDSGSLSFGTTSYLVGGLPLNGSSVWVRLWYGCSGVWKYVDAQYTAAIPSITSHATGSTLSSSSETFTWTANGIAVTEWWIYAGPSTGSRAYLDSGSLGLTTSKTINSLPTDGSLVFIRLWFKLSGVWKYLDYQYVSSGSGAPLSPSITSFAPGSSIPDTNAVFNWNTGGLTVADWWLQIGTSRGAFNLHNSGSLGTKLSTTIASLPTSVNPIYVRLWFYAGGGWKFLDYQYSVCDYPNDATCQPEWNVVKPDPNFNSAFTSIWGTSDNNIFVVGLDGAIYHFNGAQWSQVITTATAQLQDIWGSSASDIHIIGKNSTWIHYDGTSWTNSTFDFLGITKIGIHGSAPNDVWVAHNSGVSHFDGTSWSTVTTETAVGRDIVVFDSNDIWIANENDSTGNGEIWQGGGTAWAGSATGWWGEYSTSTSVLNGIWGTSSTNLYAVGNNGVVAHRGPFGTWQELNINAGNTTLGNVTGNAANNVFIAGYGGFLSHFDGTTWTNENPSVEIGGMWISPSGKVYGAGSGGNVLIRTLEKIP